MDSLGNGDTYLKKKIVGIRFFVVTCFSTLSCYIMFLFVYIPVCLNRFIWHWFNINSFLMLYKFSLPIKRKLKSLIIRLYCFKYLPTQFHYLIVHTTFVCQDIDSLNYILNYLHCQCTHFSFKYACFFLLRLHLHYSQYFSIIDNTKILPHKLLLQNQFYYILHSNDQSPQPKQIIKQLCSCNSEKKYPST